MRFAGFADTVGSHLFGSQVSSTWLPEGWEPIVPAM